MFCYGCGEEIQVKDRVGRQASCPQCGRSLRVCKNCRFFDSRVHHDCRETEAEWVREKDQANFCDYFVPLDKPHRKKNDKSEEARRKLDGLFNG